MDTETLKLIESALDKFGVATSEVVVAYTNYFIFSSLIWIAFGGFLIYASVKIKDKISDSTLRVIVPCIGILLGSLWIAVNASDLVAPKAAAIHQLLRDIQSDK